MGKSIWPVVRLTDDTGATLRVGSGAGETKHLQKGRRQVADTACPEIEVLNIRGQSWVDNQGHTSIIAYRSKTAKPLLDQGLFPVPIVWNTFKLGPTPELMLP